MNALSPATSIIVRNDLDNCSQQQGLAPTGQPDLTLARRYAEAEKSEGTRRGYSADWARFTAWAASRGYLALPASPETIAAYVADNAAAGIRPSTITRRVSAIRYAHKLAGFTESPTNTELVKATMRGIRRTIGTAPDRKSPATAQVVASMLALCRADTLIGTRDRALLALGFAGAFRRSELVALEVEDLVECADGLRVTIRRSKTDQEGAGQSIAILRGVRICPVEAVQTWLARAEISTGLVFRSVLKGGHLGGPLPPQRVSHRVKHYAKLAGLDPRMFSGHSLRAGFCTSAAEHGASVWKMMDVSRHKSVNTLRGYVRNAESFKDHAGAAFL
jgi:site-specific recombinase XerD